MKTIAVVVVVAVVAAIVAYRLVGHGAHRAAAAPPAPVAAASGPPMGVSYQSLSWDGVIRQWRLFIPTGTPANAHLPLLVMLHAAGSGAELFVTETSMDTYAQKYHFVTVAPEGIDATWNAGTCCGAARDQGVDDIGFVNAMLGRVDSLDPVDPSQIYVAGASNGGMLGYALACRIAYRVQAVFSAGGAQTLSDCDPDRPVSIIEFHSLSDTLVPYNGGVEAQYAQELTPFPSADSTFAAWAQRDECQASVVKDAGGGEQVQVWYGCADNALLEVWLRQTGGGHEWPVAPEAPVDASVTIAKAIASGSLLRHPGASSDPFQ